MEFTLNKDRVLHSVQGHSIEFKKGVPTHVPPDMYNEVIGIGAQPTSEIVELGPKDSPEPHDPLVRKAMIFAAFEKIVLANVRENFTASGAPNGKALATAIGFEVNAKERDNLWREFQTGKAE